MMLRSIEILKTVGPLKKGFRLELDKPITLITGKQKSGKSLLLHKLHKLAKGKEEDVIAVETCNKERNPDAKLYYFDSEHDNPRVQNGAFCSSPMDFMLQANSKLDSSHGKTISELVFGLLENLDGDMLMLDEPESGLCVANIGKLTRLIRKASKHSQLLIVTHHPALLCLPQKDCAVFDMETKQYCDGKEYVLKRLGNFLAD